LETLIKLYTGKKPLIIEYSKIGKPMALGGDVKIGITSLLIKTPFRGFRLGDDSILGKVALRDMVQSTDDPFLPMTYRFKIILELSLEEFACFEKGLKRILDEEKPAHTVYDLHIVKEMKVGIGAYVGISTKISDYRPMRIGVDSVLGSGVIVFDIKEISGKIELRSKLEIDTILI
jgi:hypothetical protein